MTNTLIDGQKLTDNFGWYSADNGKSYDTRNEFFRAGMEYCNKVKTPVVNEIKVLKADIQLLREMLNSEQRARHARSA